MDQSDSEAMFDDVQTSISHKYPEHDLFTIIHFDAILDIYYDFTSRFHVSPYFLEHMTPTKLTNFIERCIEKRTKTPNQLRITRFINYYNDELDMSYNILSNFLQRYGFKVSRDHWYHFCYVHSDLSELNYCQFLF